MDEKCEHFGIIRMCENCGHKPVCSSDDVRRPCGIDLPNWEPSGLAAEVERLRAALDKAKQLITGCDCARCMRLMADGAEAERERLLVEIERLRADAKSREDFMVRLRASLGGDK